MCFTRRCIHVDHPVSPGPMPRKLLMLSPHDSRQNRLLAALPEDESTRLFPHLELSLTTRHTDRVVVSHHLVAHHGQGLCLGRIDLIVGMNGVFASQRVTEVLIRNVSDYLVHVHVGLGARACLLRRYREFVEAVALNNRIDHFLNLDWVASDPLPRDQAQSHRIHEPEYRGNTM